MTDVDHYGALNIGIVTGSLSPAAGGLYESVRLPANRMAAQGHRVTVYGQIDSQFAQSRTAWAVTDLKAYYPVGPSRFGYSPAMKRDLLTSEHDLVHLHGLWSYRSIATFEWRKEKRRPTVVSPRGMLTNIALQESSIRKRIARLLYEERNLCRANVIHALNRAEAQEIRRIGYETPLAVIPNGIDVPLASSISRIASRHGDGRKTLVFLGRLHPLKGVVQLLEGWRMACASAKALKTDWQLVVAGWDDGGHLDRFKAIAHDLGISQDVTFPGPVYGEQKIRLLRSCDAFILPSRNEGLPMSILEAWAYSIPTIMTAACNLEDSFGHGAAIRVEPDSRSIGRVLADVLSDEDVLSETGRRGRNYVEINYAMDRILAEHKQLYSWLTTGGPRPDFVEAAPRALT